MGLKILEEHGYFWWHTDAIDVTVGLPEGALSGLLTISSDGNISLELHGILTPVDGFLSILDGDNQPDQNARIGGILKGGSQHVLLMELSRSGGTLASRGISFETFSATACLVGHEPVPAFADEPLFTKLRVPLRGFEEWLRLGSIEISRDDKTLSANYREPSGYSYALEDGNLNVQYALHSAHWNSQRSWRMEISEEVSLEFAFRASAPLSRLREAYGQLEDLLILLTDCDCALEWPYLHMGDDSHAYRYYFPRISSQSKTPSWRQCVALFPQLAKDFGNLYANWSAKLSQLGPAAYLYLSTRRGMEFYPEHHFVTLIWGLESLHHNRAGDSFGDRKRSSKVYLSKRLFEVLSDLPVDIEASSLKAFCKDSATIRNVISHYGGERRGANYGEDFLIPLLKRTQVLSRLYHLVLLKEIGVPDAVLRRWMDDGFGAHQMKTAMQELGLRFAVSATAP